MRASSPQPPALEHWGSLEIRRRIGAGVFGEVFLAWDATLQREVALKLLRPEMERIFHEHGDLDASILQEGRNLARVRHPNVVTIYGAEELEGRIGVWMEHIRGQTLESLLRENGPFGAPEAALVGIEVCRALTAVHGAGLVHRDVKAANVMREAGGRIVLMDFGAGVDVRKLGRDDVQAPAGTPVYLAPEILRGEPASPATDLYAVGVLLFHLVTGTYPVEGASLRDLLRAHESDQGKLLRDLRPDLAEPFLQVVEKALSLRPEDRFATAGQMEQTLAKALSQQSGSAPLERGEASAATRTAGAATRTAAEDTRSQSARRRGLFYVRALLALLGLAAGIAVVSKVVRLRGAGFAREKTRIVVLPFENLGDASNEYFAEGITEEITSRLSEIAGLGVIARTSAMQYKKAAQTIQSIGSELRVSYILEGTVRWQQDPGGVLRVRVTPQLIRVDDETHVWSGRYDALLADIFQVQANVAEQVAGALNLTLLHPDRQTAGAEARRNLDAYHAYLQGKAHYRRLFQEEDARKAVALFEKAAELDPEFAEAHAALSTAQSWLGWEFNDEPQFAGAKAALDQALALAPDLAEVHVANGYYLYYAQRDYASALRQFERVRELQPNNAEAIAVLGFIQRRLGKWDEAVRSLQRAFDLDPRAGDLALSLGDTYLRLRQYARAESYYDRAIALTPDVREAYRMKVELYLLWDGTPERALQVITGAPARIRPAELLIGGFSDLQRSVFAAQFAEDLERFSPVESERVSWYFARATAARARDRSALAAACFDSARVLLESQVRAAPDEYRGHGDLGYAYAGLGRAPDAIREGRRAVELLPVAQDAFSSPRAHVVLARILVLAGEYDAAIGELEYVLSMPSTLSGAGLRVDPTWQPLHANSRFGRLLQKSLP